MRVCLSMVLLLSTKLSLSLSIISEDLDGSGNDISSSGFSSMDLSEEDIFENKNSNDKPNVDDDDHYDYIPQSPASNDESGMTFNVLWTDDRGQVAKTRSFLENKDIMTAVIAGGVTGLILAAALVAVLICKRKRTSIAKGYSLGQQA